MIEKVEAAHVECGARKDHPFKEGPAMSRNAKSVQQNLPRGALAPKTDGCKKGQRRHSTVELCRGALTPQTPSFGPTRGGAQSTEPGVMNADARIAADRAAPVRGFAGRSKSRREIDPHYLSWLLAHIEIDPKSGCWHLRGRKPGRYLVIWVGNERIKAHRYVYESLVGAIRPGFVIDHLCKNRGCVNPLHLEQVTVAENTRRAAGLKNRTKTHCFRGHPLSGRNLYVYYDRAGKPHRVCRACRVVTARAYRARQKQLSGAEASSPVGAVDDYEPAGRTA